jgi:hypothetical protein
VAICSDPALTFLNGLGYNVIRLPRSGIEPLDVLGRDGKSIERLGRLGQIWASTKATPAPGPADAAAIRGQRTDALNLSIGLKVLTAALGAMGAVVPELGFTYSRARKIQFAFADVQAVTVDPFLVGDYLSAGDLASVNPFVTHYFEDDGTETYVITEVLTSGSIAVTATDEDGKGVSVDVPAIAQALGAKVTVRSDTAGAREVTYTGSPVAFGFKAFGIAHVNGGWRIHGVKPGADLAFVAGAGVDGAGVVPTPGTFTLVERGQAVQAVVLARRLIDWR